MKPPDLKKAPGPSTRQRLLSAAMKVFARDGLHGATTRAIAEEAGVNEVTLFRHFQTKEGLLSAVMTQAVQTGAPEELAAEVGWTEDLLENLQTFGQGFYARMTRDEAFIRTMVGETGRHPDHARKIIRDAVKPMRERFITRLEAARQAGRVRGDVDLGMAADAFTAMLFGGMLRNTAGCCEGDYTPEQYVSTCVAVFAAGLAPLPGNQNL